METFISFDPDADRPFFERLCRVLKHAGHGILSLNLKQRYGEDISSFCDDFPFNHDCVLVLVSNSLAKSEWHAQELAAFRFHEANRGRERTIVPLMLEDVRLPAFLRGTAVAPTVNFTGDFDRACQRLLKNLERQIRAVRQAFVIMKLDGELNRIYGTIKTTLKGYGFEGKRITDITKKKNQFIPLEIIRAIANSGLVVADVTGERPNCYYEIGYAHALKKEVIVTARKGTKLHFDIAGIDVLFWNDNADLRRKLEKTLNTTWPRIHRRARPRPPRNPPDKGAKQSAHSVLPGEDAPRRQEAVKAPGAAAEIGLAAKTDAVA